MSEEEILKIMKNLILMPYDWIITDKYDGKLDFIGSLEGNEAIQGLLDLYNKEKEKNKELNRLKGFEMLDIFNMGKESSRQRIKHDWVEKEKVRQKLKEEQERLKAGFGKMYQESLGNSATKILQELLEE